MEARIVVLTGVGLYMAVLLAIGFWAGRQVKDTIDFAIAGRRLPLWLCTATLFATWFGGGTCVGAAGAAFNDGFPGVIADPFGAALCLLLAGLFYVRMLRRMGLVTLADFFRSRFGVQAELLAAVLSVPPFLAWAGAQFVAFGYVLHSITGMDQTTAILLGAAVVLVYTLQGGMWAVSITDFFQALILIAGLVFLVPLALSDVGGWQAVQKSLPSAHMDFLPAPSFRDWFWYVEAWLIIGLGSIPSQDLLQRSFGARNERVAQNSAYISAALYLVVGIIPVLLGMIGRIVLPDISDPELILPELGLKYLHPAGLALFAGALLSAIMSSADSALLAPTTIFTENLLPYIKPNLATAQKLRWTRWLLFWFVMIGLAIALWFQTVYDLMVDSMALGLAAMIVPFTCGLYWKKANSWGANASIIAGTLTWIVASAVQSEYPADLLGTLVSAMTMFVVTRATYERVPPLPLKNEKGEILSYSERLGVR